MCAPLHRLATNISEQEGTKRIPPSGLGAGSFRCFEMARLGDVIYWLGCLVAAVLLVLGAADYWFGQGRLGAFISWAVLAAATWGISYAVRYVLADR
jgi:hypothetical protein